MEDFPTGFSAAAFPLDSMNVKYVDIKKQVLKGLKAEKPVILTAICISQDKSYDCSLTHSLVITGFKSVEKGSIKKDIGIGV